MTNVKTKSDKLAQTIILIVFALLFLVLGTIAVMNPQITFDL